MSENEKCPCCGNAMEDSQECQFCEHCEYEENQAPFWSKHLREVDETYLEHGLVAASLSLKLALSAVAQAVHAVLPFVKPPFGTDVCSMVEYMEGKKPENRVKSIEE